MAPLAQVADEDGREIGIAAGGEYGEAVPRRPQHQPSHPLLKPEADRRGERAVDDGDRPRRAAQEDRRAERAMDRRLEALDKRRGWRGGAHATSAPPPNEKTPRKKDGAANAMLTPNTTRHTRRDTPPTSAKPRAKPVTNRK